METSRPDEAQPITRDEWLALVDPQDGASVEPLRCRRFCRHQADGQAEVICMPVKRSPAVAAAVSCRLVQVSRDGLTLRSRQEVPAGAAVNIGLDLGDQVIVLSGTVVHCTQTVGGFKVGVQLSFTEAGTGGDEEENADQADVGFFPRCSCGRDNPADPDRE